MATASLNIDFNGFELLVVEDDPTSALLLSRMLSKHGAQVDTAVNGADALLKFQEKHFRIIITDINMPVMNGYEVCFEMKQDARLGVTDGSGLHDHHRLPIR